MRGPFELAEEAVAFGACADQGHPGAHEQVVAGEFRQYLAAGVPARPGSVNSTRVLSWRGSVLSGFDDRAPGSTGRRAVATASACGRAGFGG